MVTDFGAELPARAVAEPDPQPSRSPAASSCAPYRDATELGLARGRNAMAIWQELVDTYGFTAGYQSVRRFVTKLHPSQPLEARALWSPSLQARRSWLMSQAAASPASVPADRAAFCIDYELPNSVVPGPPPSRPRYTTPVLSQPVDNLSLLHSPFALFPANLRWRFLRREQTGQREFTDLAEMRRLV